MSLADEKALVLFSGGQDSTVSLAWALERFGAVETVGFDYRQRHAVELSQRPVILAAFRDRFPEWRAKLGQDHLLDFGFVPGLGATAMTEDAEITFAANGLPTTFVPGRNLLFFTAAAALAYRRDSRRLVGGMCETDYSGYPDCRDDTLKALQATLSMGMDRRVVIETPLMWRDKAETWVLAERLGGQALVDLVIEETHSCYLGDRTHRHAWGYGCGTCPACQLRKGGWERWTKTGGGPAYG